MDITVTIPNAKAANIIAALDARDPAYEPPTGTATQIRDALAAHFSAKWKDEVRVLLKDHRRNQAIQAVVAADEALSDPLA